ncbi:MAG: pirin family protein [Pseudomonadales bacterium]
MTYLRRSDERGHVNLGWLDSRHTFSFGNYHDPRHMGFATLRVINEDRVVPGEGFGAHGHRDMEILTYVLDGALEHRDSLGNGSVIRPGDVQRMTAGRGIRHSEFNASSSEPVHFLQMWVLPEAEQLTPGYEQKHFAPEMLRDQLRLIASRDGDEGSVSIHQAVDLYASHASTGHVEEVAIDTPVEFWLQVVAGRLEVAGETLAAGDGLGLEGVEHLEIRALEDSHYLLYRFNDGRTS